MGQRYVHRSAHAPHRPKKPVRRVMSLLGAAVLIAGAALLIMWETQGALLRPPPVSTAPVASAPVVPLRPASVPEPEPTPPLPTRLVPEGPATAWMAAVDNSLWNRVAMPAPAQPAAALAEPDYQMLALPANGLVDPAYFNTTVFVGDSLTQGMYIYEQGLPNAQFCAYKGISPKQIYDGTEHINPRTGEREVPIDAVAAHQPDNVYILLGTNAMVAMENDILLAYYEEMLNAFKARLAPEVGIYVQSITPVLQGVDRRFTYEDILYLNNNLARIAVEKGVYFVNLHEAMAGDDGWMRPEFGARDGYHLQPLGYTAWVDYLRTHTVFKARHAGLYLERGDVYSQLPKPEVPAPPPAEAGGGEPLT